MEKPRLVFITDDLSAYERINPDEFPDYDEVDSREVGHVGEYEGDDAD